MKIVMHRVQLKCLALFSVAKICASLSKYIIMHTNKYSLYMYLCIFIIKIDHFGVGEKKVINCVKWFLWSGPVKVTISTTSLTPH